MNKNARFEHLLELYAAGNISASDHDELFELLATHKYDETLSRYIKKDLAEYTSGKTGDLPPHIAEEIVRNVFEAEKNTSRVLPLKKPSRHLLRWAVAASIVVVISLGSYFLLSTSRTENSRQSFARLIPDNPIIETNNTDQQQTIILPDGSSVTLQKDSRLHYARQFSADKREVFLEGEAFFQVTKSPGKPFLVYYNNIVTRVLGTSFNVNTNAQTGNIEVAVKTGKVQVYENDKLLKDPISKSVILTPNQKLIYKPQNRVFETQLVEQPQPIIEDYEKENKIIPFVYDQEELMLVFKDIETKYGIEIILENTNLNNCVFTGDVSSQDLYTKLKIICLTTNASFEINGTKILIKGKGCN